MNILCGESVEKVIIYSLRKEYKNVNSVVEEKPGISDFRVLLLSNKYNSILLTADKDFGEIIFRTRAISNRVVLYRLLGLSNSEKSGIILKSFRKYGDDFEIYFTVITKVRIRIKKL